MQILPQIDWLHVPAREAYYFGIMLGGVTMFFACLFLYFYLKRKSDLAHEADCDECYQMGIQEGRKKERAQQSGITFSEPKKRHLTVNVAADPDTLPDLKAYLDVRGLMTGRLTEEQCFGPLPQQTDGRRN